MNDSKVKQVIVIRKDLKMRKGKCVAQGAHASISWLVDRVLNLSWHHPDEIYELEAFSKEEKEWMLGRFTKVCVQVESENELMEIYNKALQAQLTVHLITDAGLTEFNGIATKTCLCVGPNNADDIDQVTGHLNLY